MNTRFRFFAKPFSLSLLMLFAYSRADEVVPNALELLRKCPKVNSCSRTALDVQLSFGLSRPSILSEPSISATGDQVYVFYNNTGDPTQVMAELFNNVSGQLVSAQTLLGDPSFPFQWEGFASPDFTKFSVLESTFNPGPQPLRIRLLDPNFNVIAQRTFTADLITFGNGGFGGGTFSEDGHYVLVAYSVNTNLPNTSMTVQILDATSPTLPTVASTTILGFDTNAPLLFTLTDSGGNKNLYMQFFVAQGQFSLTTEATTLPPFFSQVYKVDTVAGTITLVDQAPLPKFVESAVSVRSSGRDALISHGGFCSLFPTQLSIYDTNALKTTFLPNDNAEARVFLFDGQKLNLVIKQPTNCCNRTVPYPPGNGCTYLFGQNEVSNVNCTPDQQFTVQEYWVLADLEQASSGPVFRPQNLPNQDMKSGISAFSADGNWLLRVGAHGYCNGNPNLDQLGIHNVLLFKVVTNGPFTPICQ